MPSCHDRRPSILENLDQFSENTKINVFIYDFEERMYDWLVDKRVKKIIVPAEYLTIQKMRLFIQNYMGRCRYWVCDDDLYGVQLYSKKKINVGLALKMIETMIEDKNIERFTAIGYSFDPWSIAFWDGTLYREVYATVLLLYDGAVCDDIGLKYTGDTEINEDLEFGINSIILGCSLLKCRWGYLLCYGKSGDKRSIASTPDLHWKYQCEAYVKFGDWVSLVLERRRIFTGRIRYKRIGKEKTWDKELLELCKNRDYKGVEKYLNDKKNKNKKNI